MKKKSRAGRVLTYNLETALKKYPECHHFVLHGPDSYSDEGSAMWEIIHRPVSPQEHKSIITHIYLIGQEPVAWSWIIPVKRRYNHKLLPLYSFMVYVKKTYRKKGIAKRLCQKAMEFARAKHRRLLVHPWSVSSYSLYQNLKIPSRNQVDYYLTDQKEPR